MRVSNKYYKVVRTDYKLGKLYSVNKKDEFPDEYRVEYKVGEYVKPRVKDTLLFVFDNFEHARVFAVAEMGCEGVEIYECEVKDPKYVGRLAFAESIHEFWQVCDKYISLYVTFPAPPGTVACTAVKLTKIIPLEEG